MMAQRPQEQELRKELRKGRTTIDNCLDENCLILISHYVMQSLLFS